MEEARQRARLLHGTIHDTLQVVHARYFREGEGLMFPADTLKDVFKGWRGARRRGPLAGRQREGDERRPRPEGRIRDGGGEGIGGRKDEYELSADGVYRYAGLITLRSECLKCHLPNRTSNKSRAAGLVISMPVGKRSTPPGMSGFRGQGFSDEPAVLA